MEQAGRTEYVRIVTKRGEYLSPNLDDWKLFFQCDDVVLAEQIFLTPLQVQQLVPSTKAAEQYISKLRTVAGVNHEVHA